MASPSPAFLRFGYLPLPLFLATAWLGSLLAPDHDPVAFHLSVLTRKAGPALPVVKSGLVLVGATFTLFGLGLWRATGRAVSLGALCTMAYGVAMISNGVWPQGSPLHGLYALGVCSLIGPALTQLELRPFHDDRPMFRVTVAVSLAGLLYLWLNLTGFDPRGYQGLTQLVASVFNSFWPAYVARRLLRS